ncbi:MAG: XTP/dITP diphosphatase [Desulfuromonadales bacterium]|nr:MAG: XTP/dITP diphosphatase [Desulfuromonadales bacterium]
MISLVVATRNKGKLLEIVKLLEGLPVRVLSFDDFEDVPVVDEDGSTFEANAIKKAKSAARDFGCLALADDSGLVVDALEGEPGIYSARYAGEGATDADNNAKLLREMASVPPDRRDAAFCCVLALCGPERDCSTFTGEVRGVILEQAVGEGGFGYDPLFLVKGEGKTMAELPLEVKNRISHRAKALEQVKEFLSSLLGS